MDEGVDGSPRGCGRVGSCVRLSQLCPGSFRNRGRICRGAYPPSFQSGEELGLAALAAVDGEAAGLLVRLVWWLIKVAVADIIAYEVATA